MENGVITILHAIFFSELLINLEKHILQSYRFAIKIAYKMLF